MNPSLITTYENISRAQASVNDRFEVEEVLPQRCLHVYHCNARQVGRVLKIALAFLLSTSMMSIQMLNTCSRCNKLSPSILNPGMSL